MTPKISSGGCSDVTKVNKSDGVAGKIIAGGGLDIVDANKT
jgi:hypothetical protein